jgi:hypothetical protein
MESEAMPELCESECGRVGVKHTDGDGLEIWLCYRCARLVHEGTIPVSYFTDGFPTFFDEPIEYLRWVALSVVLSS